ncbi:MAG: tRNA (adenosine(37)-N6)-threonylcarbamoyltransferase complex ATPase subunit type 1 TsaE [Gemmatimonadetes bacterium]|nr:tRNA (adenosine(37)-N6)-threonylcarbamoyltransferase complex ATPase subunit type 1 TsaE [Gemmatimonadota bacterium]
MSGPVIRLLDSAALAEWGQALGASLRAPALVALSGELGAGKTTLAQAIARGLGVTQPVTSPTFALVQEYAGTTEKLVHLDLYRLRSASELPGIGWEDILAERAIVLVEWPERAGAALPSPTLAIHLAHVPGRSDVREVRT